MSISQKAIEFENQKRLTEAVKRTENIMLIKQKLKMVIDFANNPIIIKRWQNNNLMQNTMYGMDKKNLQLMPHDVSWKDDFLSEGQRIKSAVNDSSIRIEHVGSTSIPNIYAKPILDIAILCGAKGLEAVANALPRLGYEYRGQFDEEVGHYYAVLDDGDIRLCQVHIFLEANADWHSKLKFRDVLRENAELAKEYNDYKLALAKTMTNKSKYAEIKTKWVDKFILKIS